MISLSTLLAIIESLDGCGLIVTDDALVRETILRERDDVTDDTDWANGEGSDR